MEVSPGFLADFLSAALFGPLSGAVVAASAVLGQRDRGGLSAVDFYFRTAIYAAAWAICGGLSGLFYWTFRDVHPSPVISLAVAGVGAGVVYQAANYLVFLPVVYLRRGIGPIAWFKEAFARFLPFHFFFVFMCVSLLYTVQGPGNTQDYRRGAIFLLPILGIIYAFRAYAQQSELNQRLERFSLQMAGSMITALDLKDNYTAQHSAAVAQYSYDIATELGLPPKECNLAHLAGLLHDLGKISVPDEVLNRRGELLETEWHILQDHCVAGQHILSDMDEFDELGDIVLYHHEHWDGGGYPKGLEGEDIPLLSRIVTVADCYSAMISDRPYHQARTPKVAMAELWDQRGRQFDPQLVDLFLHLLEAGDWEYRTAQHADFHVQTQKVRFLQDIA